jgi:hypothetical protein
VTGSSVGRETTAWRDPKRGKHHLFVGTVSTALCGQVLHIGWESEKAVRWADEDCCKRCADRAGSAK